MSIYKAGRDEYGDEYGDGHTYRHKTWVATQDVVCYKNTPG